MSQRVARVGKNNRAQVVTIPLEYRFPEGMKEVFIRKVGEEVILSPRPSDWSAFLASDARPARTSWSASMPFPSRNAALDTSDPCRAGPAGRPEVLAYEA